MFQKANITENTSENKKCNTDGDVSHAISTANDAISTANNAISTANDAISTANDAISTAAGAITEGNTCW